MGRAWLWLLSEEETQEKSYNAFKRFWIKLFSIITFKTLRDKHKEEKKSL